MTPVYGRSRGWSARSPAATPSGDSLWRGNEPAGMTFIGETTFSTNPENGWAFGGGSGQFELTTDSSAPHSPPSVMHAWFPPNYAAGDGPVGFDKVFDVDYRTLYCCYWHKYSSNYVNEVIGTKEIYFHTVPDFARPFFIARNDGPTGLAPWVFDQGGVTWHPTPANGNHAPNLVPSTVITPGAWVLNEIILVGNTAGNEDGSLDWYQDGVHVGSYTYEWDAAGVVWHMVHGTTIYGGTGDFSPAYQIDLWWDHIYLSGKN